MPQPPVTHSIESLSTTELTRAIHIDFEGHQEQAPVLLGVLIDQRYESFVLDPTLRSAAAAKGLRVADGRVVLAELLERARREERLICAFGTSELKWAHTYFGVDLDDVYLNAHKVVKRWWRRTNPDVQPARATRRNRRRGSRRAGYSQEFFEKNLGLKRPPHLVSGYASSRIRAVRNQLDRGLTYHELTRTAKAKWTKLLQYNETDVRNLAAVMSAVRVLA